MTFLRSNSCGKNRADISGPNLVENLIGEKKLKKSQNCKNCKKLIEN